MALLRVCKHRWNFHKKLLCGGQRMGTEWMSVGFLAVELFIAHSVTKSSMIHFGKGFWKLFPFTTPIALFCGLSLQRNSLAKKNTQSGKNQVSKGDKFLPNKVTSL